MLTAGSKKGATSNGSDGNGSGGGGRERWVQFGTVASARLSLQDLTAKDAELDRESTSRLLQEYLSLPVEEYSLLDPKWVVREHDDDDNAINNNLNSSAKKSRNNSFRVSVPLKDMLGVDICPQVSIEARPDPLNSQVTLIGSRAVLGSPGLDDMFKLKLVAVMRCRRNDRHLPGRPVQRLRQWAAKRRGNTSASNNNLEVIIDSSGSSASSSSSGGGGAAVAEVIEVEDVELDQINFSSEEDDDEEEAEIVASFSDITPGSDESDSSSSFRFSRDITIDDDTLSSSASTSTTTSSSPSFDGEPRNNAVVTTLSSSSNGETTSTTVAATAPLLDCRVQINMAVKVPGALRVVPNGLLGYAGSVITKTVLNAVLPNFLQLLSTDFKQWVAGGGRRKENLDLVTSGSNSINSGEDMDVKGLFTPLIGSTTASSSSDL